MESRTYIIGRSRSCDIQLSDATVSSRHAELIFMDDVIHLADLGSTNGSYILTKEGFKSFTDGYVKPEQKFAFGHYVCSIFQLIEMLEQREQPQVEVY
jgi:pSer/pThr/pTyr-binding forkhead associated (FHA) protein